ncbi:MAG TPA: hypothetical protein PKY12_11790 [Catalimonadaceae bacterium]|nr:hypothetical protein [Catalimonadaceae bacterium]
MVVNLVLPRRLTDPISLVKAGKGFGHSVSGIFPDFDFKKNQGIFSLGYNVNLSL